jgi:hypothetical protein
MVCLEELTTECCSYQKGPNGRVNLYDWLPDVLSALPSPSRLSKTSVCVKYHDREEIDNDTPFWNGVDKTLACKDSFPRFSNIVVDLPAFSSSRIYDHVSAEGLFPTLAKAGLALVVREAD